MATILLVVQLVGHMTLQVFGFLDTLADRDCIHQLIVTASLTPRLLVDRDGQYTDIIVYRDIESPR